MLYQAYLHDAMTALNTVEMKAQAIVAEKAGCTTARSTLTLRGFNPPCGHSESIEQETVRAAIEARGQTVYRSECMSR
jgi:hypothetical protein